MTCSSFAQALNILKNPPAKSRGFDVEIEDTRLDQFVRFGQHSLMDEKKDAILVAAITVFGRLGYKKSSMEDLAAAAHLSKQGLYLHFDGKKEIFTAASRKYLDDGLDLVRTELARPGVGLQDRLLGAMDAWFGRHFVTFALTSLDVIEVGDELAGPSVEKYKEQFRSGLAKAIAGSVEFRRGGSRCTSKEIAQVLFQFGLTWKEGHTSRTAFLKSVALCIKACCP